MTATEDNHHWSFRQACWVATMILLAGCGSKTGPDVGTVTGQVSLDGKPLEGVNVVFQPETGRPSIGKTDRSGKYELTYSASRTGAQVGRHSVVIEPAGPESDAAPVADAKNTRSIPARYNARTELTADVKPGRNTLHFELSSK